MTLTDQLARVVLPARLPEEFHTVCGFAVDDRAPAVDAWFARACRSRWPAGSLHCMTVRLHGHPEPSCSRPRSAVTARHQLHVALPVLTRLVGAGTRDLTDVTSGRLRKLLAACCLTWTDWFADWFLSHLGGPCRQCGEDVSKAPCAGEQPCDASISWMPESAQFVPEWNDITAALFRVTGNRSVPRSTVSLVHLRAGQTVGGNTCLTVLNTGFLRKAGESEERITAVSSWQDAEYFTAAERAALALVEATLEPSPHDRERVCGELYTEVANHYDEKALATLTVAIGQVSFSIALAVIGKPQPVSSLAHGQWD